jgi:hypothetical protein
VIAPPQVSSSLVFPFFSSLLTLPITLLVFRASSLNCYCSSAGKPPSLWLGDGIVEDVNFSGCWYDDTQREQHRMTTIIAFVAAFEGKQAEIRDEPRILGVLVHELTRILLVEGRRCGAAGQDCGNCAMATALFLLYRTQGRPQVASSSSLL